MNIIDAVKLLDENFDEHGYGKIIITSQSRNIFLINHRDGIHKCGHDWPNAYYPSKEDFLANDWEIDSQSIK